MTGTNGANWLYGGLYTARQTLAASENFKGRFDASAGSAAVLKRIHVQYLADELDGVGWRRPFAVLALAELRLRQMGQSTRCHLIPAGSVVLLLSDNARYDGDHAASAADFLTWAGNVLEDLATLAGSGGNLFFAGAELVMPPNRTARKNRVEEDFWEVAFSLHFGVGEA